MLNLKRQDISWCITRLPKVIKSLLVNNRENVVLAGGYIRSCITNDKINDIDLFVKSKDEAIRVAKSLSDKMFVTDNAFTIRLDNCPTIQIIHRWTFDSPDKIINSFDFTIARACIWWGDDSKWHSLIDDAFYSDLAAKRLVYCSPVREEEAGGSMLRVLKFYQRGYRIPLDSLGAVIARLAVAVQRKKIDDSSEESWARILTGLLYEVDPNTDFDRLSPYIEESAE
jgi:hypothetical protein